MFAFSRADYTTSLTPIQTVPIMVRDLSKVFRVPAQAIAGRLEATALVVLLVGAVGAWWFASWFWQFGLRNYTGASA
jgi:ABC-type uncharacterized transport system permease subunit